MKRKIYAIALGMLVNLFSNGIQAQEINGANMILNPSFDKDDAGWGHYFDYFWEPTNPLAAVASVSVVPKDGFTGNVYKVTITNAGTQGYSVQISYPMSLETGKKYSMKFKASADADRTVFINLQQNEGSKTDWYQSPVINLTTTPTVFGPYEYTATTTDASNLFKLYLGGGGTANGIAAYFDDIEVTEMIDASATLPDAPTIGTAIAGVGNATVSFSAPLNTGGLSIKYYTVTSNPSAISSTGTTSPITVTGLTNGTAYTFTVTTTNAKGKSAASSVSNSVTPALMPVSYYVSSLTGNDKNNGLTTGSAFATILKAEAMAIPSDTIFLLTGTYPPVTLTKSGNFSSRITYKALAGNNPVITCSPSGAWNLLSIHASYITIDGLEIKGINQSLTLAMGEKNYNDIFAIKNAGGTPTQAQWDKTTNTNTNGVSVGTGSNPSNYVTVKNCRVHDNSAGGLGSSNCDYLLFENNEVYNNGWYCMWATSGIGAINCKSLDANGSIVFRGNKVYNNYTDVKWIDHGYSDGNGIILDVNDGSDGSTAYKGKFLIENNVVFDNGGRGLYIMSAQNAVFRNNTSYWNSKRSYSSGGEMVVYASKNVTFVNNIAWANPAYSSENYAICDNGFWGSNSNITWKNNLAYNGKEGLKAFYLSKTTTKSIDNSNVLGVNPMLVNPTIDPTTADFHVKSGSPAINAGTSTLGISVNDIENTARVKKSIVDLGAYESDFSTSINEIQENDNAFKVYPNPVKNQLTIENSNSLIINQIELYSINGELVQALKNVTSKQNTINLESANSGIYILKIQTPKQNYFRKIVKD